MKKITGYLKEFWPLSILLMVFTVLTKVETLEEFSIYLSYAVSIWREILHGVVEFPLNIILSFFPMGPINVPEPVPELIAFSSFLSASLFSERLLKSIEKPSASTIALNPLLPIYKYFDDRGRYLETSIVLSLGLYSVVLVFFTLFRAMEHFGFESLLAWVPIGIVLVMTFPLLFLRTVSSHWWGYLEPKFFAVAMSVFPMVVFGCLYLIIGAVAVEKLVIQINEFVREASASSRVN